MNRYNMKPKRFIEFNGWGVESEECSAGMWCLYSEHLREVKKLKNDHEKYVKSNIEKYNKSEGALLEALSEIGKLEREVKRLQQINRLQSEDKPNTLKVYSGSEPSEPVCLLATVDFNEPHCDGESCKEFEEDLGKLKIQGQLYYSDITSLKERLDIAMEGRNMAEYIKEKSEEDYKAIISDKDEVIVMQRSVIQGQRDVNEELSNIILEKEQKITDMTFNAEEGKKEYAKQILDNCIDDIQVSIDNAREDYNLGEMAGLEDSLEILKSHKGGAISE